MLIPGALELPLPQPTPTLLRQKASDFLPANQFTFVAFPRPLLSSCSIYYDFNLGREKREKTVKEMQKNQIMSWGAALFALDYKSGDTRSLPPIDPFAYDYKMFCIMHQGLIREKHIFTVHNMLLHMLNYVYLHLRCTYFYLCTYSCALVPFVQECKNNTAMSFFGILHRLASLSVSLSHSPVLTSFVLATSGKTWPGIFDPVNRIDKKSRGSRGREELREGWESVASGERVC